MKRLGLNVVVGSCIIVGCFQLCNVTPAASNDEDLFYTDEFETNMAFALQTTNV